MDQNEAEQLKQISNHYVDKRKEIMNSTKIKVEDISGDVICKDSISTGQTTKLKNFLAKMMWIKIWILNLNFLNLKRKQILNINRVLLLNIQTAKKYLVSYRHSSSYNDY